jgi:hypothetical protein
MTLKIVQKSKNKRNKLLGKNFNIQLAEYSSVNFF